MARSVLRLLACAPLALGLQGPLAGPLAAVQQGEQPGWIGISYEVRSEDRRTPRVVITEVRRGSPAESAGIRPGDRLVAIEELTRPEQLMNVSKELTLRVGQRVEMRLERDGRPLRIEVRAGARPLELSVDASMRWVFQTDSMAESMFRAMDSLRVQLIETNDREVVTTRRTSPAVQVLERTNRETVAAPFEFFVFRSERTDSLVRAMEQMNREMESLRAREAARASEVRRSSRGRQAEEQDRRLAELRRDIEQLTRESAALRAEMAETARRSAGVEYLVQAAPRPTPAAAPTPAREETFRPLTPYLLGSNRVAGAEFIEVQPELGAYFGVESGVLVVDVSPGTPAAIAGLRPGDVVTRLDQVGVRTVEDFRFGVSQAGDTLPITVVRRGASVQVLLRRR